MTTGTQVNAVDVAVALVRAYAAGDADGMRRHAHPDVLYREVTPGGFREIHGVEGSIAQVQEEIAATERWTPVRVEAEPVGHRVRVRAVVRFKRAGEDLFYDWTEYVGVRDGLVVKRDLACGGALRGG